jgi:hypothetical protein
MKSTLTIIAGVIGAILGVSICGYVGYEFVLWLFSFVSPGQYAGLIKLVIGFVSFWCFGGLAILATFLLSAALAAVGVAAVALLPDSWFRRKPKFPANRRFN